MKYAAKYLLILGILGMSQSSILGQETQVAPIMNTAQFNLSDSRVMINNQLLEEKITVEEADGTYYVQARVLAEKILKGSISTEENNEVLRIRRQDVLIFIENGSSVADVNGETITLSHKVYSQDGHYRISIEDLKTLFDIETSYDENTQVLTVVGEDRRHNDKPEARFYFLYKDYMEGEEVTAINISRDPNQDEIVNVKWSVGTENPVIGDTLSSIFNKPKAGTYVIGLQVQDERGLWSDWTYETIKIKENKAPVIKTLTTDKEVYAPGETITFDYTYDNEEGEAITNEKWMYRKSTQDSKLAVLGKPNAFFTEGEYIVTLQIDDAKGKRSKVMEKTVQVKGEAVRSEFDYVFNEGKIGDRIDNFSDYNYRQYKDAPIAEESIVEGTLIMSDSPENVKDLGVLYEGTIQGKGRVLIHHLNKIDKNLVPDQKQKLAVAISNDGEEEVTLTLSNEAMKGPATDITRVGQKVVYDYLTGTPERKITLKPGEKQWIYTQNWQAHHCISGMFDVETEGEVRFIVAALTQDAELEKIDDLKRLPADGVHMSGTFDMIGKKYTLHLDGKEPTKLLLGDKGSLEWAQGTDIRTNTPIENKGNFGISYYVTITAEEDMGIFLNSRGSGIQGAIKWEDGKVYNVPSQGMLAQLTTRAASIGTIKKGETKTFEYILPNGSSAPVLIGFVPSSKF